MAESDSGLNKILIAGAGPAGLSCAYWASKEGFQVEVREREKRLAKKPCGELTVEEALNCTPFTGEEGWILNRIKRCRLYFNGKFVKEIDFPFGGLIIDKRAFLEDLKGEAEENGTTVKLGTPILPSEILNLPADLIVDATGAPGSLGRHAGLNYDRYELVPILQTYCNGDLEDDLIILNVLDKGFAWVFPYHDSINYGVGGYYKAGELDELLRRGQKQFDLRGIGSLNVESASVSVGGPIKKLREGKLTVAGEAAGAVMPTTGEGIRFALQSGKICFERDYEELFWKEFGVDLIAGRNVLKFLLELDARRKRGMLKSMPEKAIQFYLGSRESITSRVASRLISRFAKI
ncbi:hypothetical protein AKJ45_00770 [candidate division MSBL1 archaeon SCGC-AAA261F19]|uniref:FAD-binding domain-containing protein n=1 Tax=candidate division MSBL1 archaeon SCGC-AAA261F19 TaxID=1698275 RepID=A0A133VBA2_9EURY|nr:hypothetical protein AKJ45_00770 [candidate division MSBL1 archaeon SCGC-AAA261F19]